MFKLIPSFKGMYSISEQGVVRREYDKRNNLDRGFPGKIMSIVYTSKYPGLTLQLPNGGKKFCLIHRLLAETFIENDDPLIKTTINHKDGNKLNFSLENLEWVSMSDNLKHAVVNKLNPQAGETHRKAVLTEDKVISLREDWDCSYQFIEQHSKLLNISANTLRLALLGKTWKYTAGPIKTLNKTGIVNRKLTDDIVITAREVFKEDLKGISPYAKKLGVSRNTLRLAIIGETFKHLPLSGR